MGRNLPASTSSEAKALTAGEPVGLLLAKERLLWQETPSGMQGNPKASPQCGGSGRHQRAAVLFRRPVLDSRFRNREICISKDLMTTSFKEQIL